MNNVYIYQTNEPVSLSSTLAISPVSYHRVTVLRSQLELGVKVQLICACICDGKAFRRIFGYSTRPRILNQTIHHRGIAQIRSTPLNRVTSTIKQLYYPSIYVYVHFTQILLRVILRQLEQHGEASNACQKSSLLERKFF